MDMDTKPTITNEHAYISELSLSLVLLQIILSDRVRNITCETEIYLQTA